MWDRMAQNAYEDGQGLTWDARAKKLITYLETRLQAHRRNET
jgi:hypothetical protein